jgi:predicted GNAT superfamily acetyltransferase
MIAVRNLHSHDEFAEAVALQRAIWGFDEIELLPVRLFVVANKVGGQTIGAFDGARMIGFCLSIPGLKSDGTTYLHSHMMGVLAGYRDRGVGRLMKLEQRREALERGINLVEWTFDPLEIRNAYFNMERLGAVVRRYVLNQYGTTTSPLHGGLPTDRCAAEWWIASDRVKRIVDGAGAEPAEVDERISVPADIDRIRRENPGQAREIQKTVSDRFVECFQGGLAVIGFERSVEAGTYLLGKLTIQQDAIPN